MQSFIIPSSNQHIVHIAEDASWVLCLKRSEDPVHAPLKHCQGIGHPKEHAFWLVVTIWSLECQLPLVFGLDLDVIVPISDVKGSEKHFSMQLFQDEVDPRHGIYVLLCSFVDIMIVLYKSEAPILLVNKENWTAPSSANLHQTFFHLYELVQARTS